MANSLDLTFLTSFKTGELVTEQKLNSIFEYIGTAINENASLLQQAQIDLSKKEMATRWLGEVKTYSDIATFISQNASNPQFADNPIPQPGDILFVDDNTDDPNRPATIAPGRYLYIYSLDVNNDGEQGDVGWKIWIPFAIPNATDYNDGLLSKELYTKLNDLPTVDEINQTNSDQDDNIQSNRADINSNMNRLTSLENQATSFATSITNLNNLKQNQATNLTGFTSKNVEGNLLELKQTITNSQDVFADATIWQVTDGDGTNALNILLSDLTWSSEQLGDGTFLNKGYLKLSPNTNNSVVDDIFDAITQNPCPIIKTAFNLFQSGGPTNHPLAPECYYMNYQLNNTKNEFVEWDVPLYSEWDTTAQTIDRFLPFKISITINYTTNNLGSTDQSIEINISLIDKQIVDSQTLIWPAGGALPDGGTMNMLTISINSILKDFGKSNISIEDKTLDTIKSVLQSNMGIKELIITNNPDASALSSTVIPAKQVINLGFNYQDPDSLIITLGGVTLQNGRDYTSAGTTTNGFYNQIQFLYDIDLGLNGNLIIKGLSVVNSSLRILVWDKTTTYQSGDIVSTTASDGTVNYWIANNENINSAPSTTNSNWSEWDINIDSDQIVSDVASQLDSTINDRINTILSSKPNQAFPLFNKGQVSVFNSKQEFLDLANVLKVNYQITLTQGVDYDVYSNSQYVAIGENSETGGSNNIAVSDLPNTYWSFMIRPTFDWENSTAYRPTVWINNSPGLVKTDQQSNGGQTKLQQRDGDGANGDFTQYVTWYLNNNQNQTQFTPVYQNLYFVKWLRDITVSLWLAVKTISSWNADTSYLPSDRCYIKNDDGTYSFYYCVQANTSQNPASDTTGTYWVKDSTNMTIDDVNTAVASQLQPIVQTELNKLPTGDELIYTENQIVNMSFNSEDDFTAWKNELGITDDDITVSPYYNGAGNMVVKSQVINIVSRIMEDLNSTSIIRDAYFTTDFDMSKFMTNNTINNASEGQGFSMLNIISTDKNINNFVAVTPLNFWADNLQTNTDYPVLKFRIIGTTDTSWTSNQLNYPFEAILTYCYNADVVGKGNY